MSKLMPESIPQLKNRTYCTV
uniref:Uncharacterized protein n=1 Tax=Rhizophora mucronata TaxID=61149 RepID=A0A2P2NUL3_RHIMU